VTRNPTPPESTPASSRTSIAGRLRRRAGPQIDYDSLAACLDQLWLQDEAKAREKIKALLRQVRLDFSTLRAVRPDKRNRAKATQRIGLLVRLMNDSAVSHETIVERRLKLIEISKEVGLPNLYQRVREFAEEIGTAVLASPDPEKKLNSILHGTAGQPKRDNKERIEILAEVLKLLPGMTPSEAYKKVSEKLGKEKRANITPDAVRKIVKSVIGGMNIKDLCKEDLDVYKDIPDDCRADVCLARIIAFGKPEF